MATPGQVRHNGVHVTLAELLTLRRTGSHPSTASRQPVQSALPGVVNTTARGRGIEFVEVRPYQPGDDVRSIDWRVTARTGKVFTKLYAEERDRPACIAVDQRVNMFFGSGDVFKSVVAARLAALIGWFSLTKGNRVGALVMGEALQRVRSTTTRQSVLQLLQSVVDANAALNINSQSSLTLDYMLRECLLRTSSGTIVSIISDFHDADSQALQSLVSLGRNRQLILIKINDPLETAFPRVGHVGIGNGVDTERVFVSQRQQRQYNEERALAARQLIDCAAQCSAQLLSVSTSDQLTGVMGRYARAR